VTLLLHLLQEGLVRRQQCQAGSLLHSGVLQR
jgi:hypothetical protein